MTSNNEGQRIVFRNPKQMIYYLRKRPGQPDTEPNYQLGPGMTVEALDGKEEELLTSLGLVDIAKESPVIAKNMAATQRELATEKSKNEQLQKELDELKAQKESVGRQEVAQEQAVVERTKKPSRKK